MAQSKSDQLRAMREATAAQGERVRLEVAASRARLSRTKPIMELVARPPSPIVEAGAIPWLAEHGHCASCDKRRAALQAAMRRRRAKIAQ